MSKQSKGRLWIILLAVWGGTWAPAAWAQEGPPGLDETFSVSSMNTDLIGEASAVVRLATTHFDVEGPGAATKRVHRAVTILERDGRDNGQLVIAHDKFRTIEKLEGRIRDESGAVIRELQGSDQRDVSAISGFSLYEDTRVRLAELYHDDYPYTVEYEYEVSHDGLAHWPTWYPQGMEEPVEYTAFTVEAPTAMTVRHKVSGLDVVPQTSTSGARQQLHWAVRSLPPREPEPAGPVLAEQAASVHVAPDAFEVAGHPGDMSTWNTFGQWYYGLAQGRQTLPPETVAEVKQHFDSTASERKKIQQLYYYMQKHTRYVSIQLGLGGWQPFSATYVDKRGYGDCKALTNYLQALLEVAGITAHPVLIRRGVGAPDLLADFPSNQFNHVVLRVPRPDSADIWLESTSQTMPFGHLGASNEDRYALVVQPGESELVRTPRSAAWENRQIRHATVKLLASGDAVADVKTAYAGNQQDRVRRALVQHSGRERDKQLRELLNLPSFKLKKANFSAVKARQKEVALPLSLKLPNYGARTGKRLFVHPNLMQRQTYQPPAMKRKRTQPVNFFSYAFVDADTIVYTPPDGFAVEALPEPIRLDASFGRYAAEIVRQPDGKLAYHRRLEINETTLPPDQYDAFRTFLSRVAQADRAQIVFVKQGGS